MRKMKFNHGVEVPHYFAVVGVSFETKSNLGESKLSVYEAKKVYVSLQERKKKWRSVETSFTNLQAFWDWLSSRLRAKRKLWVFFEDLPFFADLLDFGSLIESGRVTLWREYKVKDDGNKSKRYVGCIVMGGRPSFVSCLIDGKSVCLVDLRNYFDDQSLLDIQVNNFKISTVITVDKNNKDDNMRIIHVSNIAGLMAMIFERWISEDIGCWQPTAAKLAMRAYQHYVGKHRELHHSIVTYHDDEEAKELERAAYFGGEAQLFKIGKLNEPIYYIDVCAMYPYICMSKKLPYKLIRKESNVSVEWLASQLAHYGAIAEVVIAGPGSEYPVRIDPSKRTWYRIRKHKLSEPCVIYPEGRYGTVLCGEELMDAISKGYVKEVGRVLLYELDFVLRGFMEHWWEKRTAATEGKDVVGEHMIKLIMNSLIGKFGQRSPSWEPVIDEEPPVIWGEYYKVNMKSKKYQLMRSIGGYVQKYVGLKESRFAFTPIPAFVCAAGRVLMRQLRRSFPHRSIILQDTDGFIVNAKGLEYAQSIEHYNKTMPGAIRCKGKASKGEFWTPKHFRFGHQLYLAGIPQTQYYDSPEGIIEEISHPFLSKLLLMPPGQAVREIRSFNPQLLYPRRHILPDGWTEPLLIL